MVINSLITFLFMVIFIAIPFFGYVALTRTLSVIVNKVISFGWIIVSSEGSKITVVLSRLPTVMSMEHTLRIKK